MHDSAAACAGVTPTASRAAWPQFVLPSGHCCMPRPPLVTPGPTGLPPPPTGARSLMSPFAQRTLFGPAPGDPSESSATPPLPAHTWSDVSGVPGATLVCCAVLSAQRTVPAASAGRSRDVSPRPPCPAHACSGVSWPVPSPAYRVVTSGVPTPKS